MTTLECPARLAIARLLREARLNWRLSRLYETLKALEPIVRLVEEGCDLSPSLGAPNTSERTTSSRQWARGAVRLAAASAYLVGCDDQLAQLVNLAYREWGDDATLLQIAARAAMDDGRMEDSVELVRRACALAPRRSRLLELLGRIEARAGNIDEALAAVRVAARLRPRRASLRIELAELALAAGQNDLGLSALGALIDPPCLLHARLLAGAGRWREAVEMYNRLIEAGHVTPTFQSISPNHTTTMGLQSSNRGIVADEDLLNASIERIDVLERLGDRAAIQALADAESDDPFRCQAVLVRLAEATLNMGDPVRCARLASRCRHGSESAFALALLSVAATLLGRPMLAERCRTRLGLRDQSLLARAWRRGLMAEVIAAQSSCERAGADPTQSVLEPLLEHATHVLTQVAEQSPQFADVHYHRGNCLAALGREREAVAAVDTALSINANYTDAQRLRSSIKRAA